MLYFFSSVSLPSFLLVVLLLWRCGNSLNVLFSSLTIMRSCAAHRDPFFLKQIEEIYRICYVHIEKRLRILYTLLGGCHDGRFLAFGEHVLKWHEKKSFVWKLNKEDWSFFKNFLLNTLLSWFPSICITSGCFPRILSKANTNNFNQTGKAGTTSPFAASNYRK